MRAASRSGAAGKFPGSRRQARPVLLLAATLLLAACAPAGVWAWRPVALPSASRVAGLASLRQPAAAGCGAGCGLLRPWRLRSEGRPQRQLLPDASAAGGSYWSAWHVCRGTRRAAGILNAANEDPQAEPSAKRMLDALPLPLLPSPFNSTLVGLLGNTPSRWLPGASGDKDWSIAGSGTAAPSPAAPTYSSPGIPTAGRVRSSTSHRKLSCPAQEAERAPHRARPLRPCLLASRAILTTRSCGTGRACSMPFPKTRNASQSNPRSSCKTCCRTACLYTRWTSEESRCPDARTPKDVFSRRPTRGPHQISSRSQRRRGTPRGAVLGMLSVRGCL